MNVQNSKIPPRLSSHISPSPGLQRSRSVFSWRCLRVRSTQHTVPTRTSQTSHLAVARRLMINVWVVCCAGCVGVGRWGQKKIHTGNKHPVISTGPQEGIYSILDLRKSHSVINCEWLGTPGAPHWVNIAHIASHTHSTVPQPIDYLCSGSHQAANRCTYSHILPSAPGGLFQHYTFEVPLHFHFMRWMMRVLSLILLRSVLVAEGSSVLPAWWKAVLGSRGEAFL